MSDLRNDVRSDIMRRLHEHAPTMPFEMKFIIAEDAARDVEDYATPGPRGEWPLDTPATHEHEDGEKTE